MAQGGSRRPSGKAGKARSAGRGAATRASSPGRGGSASGQAKQRAAAQRALRGARDGNRLVTLVVPIAVVAVVAVAVIVGVLLSNHKSPTNSATPSLPPGADTSASLLANTAGQATGATVDGVSSNDMEQVLFHVHAHLSIYVNGTPKLIPYGVGIVPPYQLQNSSDGPFVAGGTKYYWLHTHDETGVIHIESPQQRTFTLGNFFDIWNQPLSATQVGPDKGAVTAFVNGQKYTGDPRNIPLNAHNVIQLDVGTVVPFASYNFPQGL